MACSGITGKGRGLYPGNLYIKTIMALQNDVPKEQITDSIEEYCYY
jgi:hypothetical protein